MGFNSAFKRLIYVKHNYFIIYEATCFGLFKTVIMRPSKRSSQQMLCTCLDSNMFTLIKYIKSSRSVTEGMMCVLNNCMWLKYLKWWLGVTTIISVPINSY